MHGYRLGKLQLYTRSEEQGGHHTTKGLIRNRSCEPPVHCFRICIDELV